MDARADVDAPECACVADLGEVAAPRDGVVDHGGGFAAGVIPGGLVGRFVAEEGVGDGQAVGGTEGEQLEAIVTGCVSRLPMAPQASDAAPLAAGGAQLCIEVAEEEEAVAGWDLVNQLLQLRVEDDGVLFVLLGGGGSVDLDDSETLPLWEAELGCEQALVDTLPGEEGSAGGITMFP